MSKVVVGATASVSATPEDVWSVLSDHEGMRDWLPGMRVRITKEGIHPGGIGTVREVRTPGLPLVVEEIKAFDVPHRLGYIAHRGMPLRNYGAEVRLSRVSTGTRIDYEVFCDRRAPGVDRVLAAGVARVLLTGLCRAVRKNNNS